MKLTMKPGRGEKVHLLVDNVYTATTNQDHWFSTGLKNGDELTEEQLADLLAEVSYRRMYDKALTLLSSRDYSRKELSDKLVRKAMEKERLNSRDFGATEASFSEVVLSSQRTDYELLHSSASRICDRLEELHLLDDHRFAENYARELVRNKHMSARGISQKLAEKGISRDLIQVILEDLDLDPQEGIMELLRTKFRSRNLEDEKQKRRTVAALARLGYNQSDIYRAISAYQSENSFSD